MRSELGGEGRAQALRAVMRKEDSYLKCNGKPLVCSGQGSDMI